MNEAELTSQFCNLSLDFITSLRCENFFDKNLFNDLKAVLLKLISIWETEKKIPIKAVPCLCDLVSQLSGGSRFLSESDAVLTEDAGLEILDMMHSLE
ncbi:MAG: hypothetical protein IJY19_07410 [Ruminococcus sp.]|nr:hypothetical protein [Ruminococcus sp.]